MPGSLSVGLAAAHGRATTRAVHPVISRTVSRAAVADRLRMGFDKSPPAPLLALVAALAQQGRNSSISRPPLCGPCGFRSSETKCEAKCETNGSVCPPHPHPRSRTQPRLNREVLPLSPRSKRQAAEKRSIEAIVCVEAPKKWRLRYTRRCVMAALRLCPQRRE